MTKALPVGIVRGVLLSALLLLAFLLFCAVVAAAPPRTDRAGLHLRAVEVLTVSNNSGNDARPCRIRTSPIDFWAYGAICYGVERGDILRADLQWRRDMWVQRGPWEVLK